MIKNVVMRVKIGKISLFNKNGKLSGGVAKICKKCYNEHPAVKKLEIRRRMRLKSAAKDGDYQFYIKKRIGRIIPRCKFEGIPVDITIVYMTQLWEQQHGKCHYTGLPMTGSGTDKGLAVWNSPSVDRLIPDLGYVQGNVVWCLNCINSFKGQLTESEFKEIVRTISWTF